MSSILDKVEGIDPNNVDAIKNVLTLFIQNLSKHTENDCYRWLKTLESVITRFPKYCMAHRNAIETYIKHFLDSTNYWLVVESAKCAHVLQQVRPIQEKTATPKSSWHDQMQLLCNASHTLVQTIFTNSIDIYNMEHNLQKMNTEKNMPSTVLATAISQINVVKNCKADKITSEAKMNILCTRLHNLLIFIQAMLVEVYPVGKLVWPPSILNVIVRILSISSSTNEDDRNSRKNISSIKIQALRTLDALITCLNKNLIQYSPLLFRCTIQTIRWSSEHASEESSKVRCQAYNSLSKWLTTLQCHIPNSKRSKDVRTVEQELVEFIIQDITPAKHVVQLTMSKQSTKNLSKKAKRKLANTMLEQSNIANHMPGERNKAKLSDDKNDEITIAALSCAEVFLTVSGTFLHKNTYELLLSCLINECYNIESYSDQRSLHLLRALEACRKSTRPDAPYAAKYCLPLYANLRNSPHMEISRLCLQGSLDIRIQLQGAPPSLIFEVERRDKEFEPEHSRKELSEMNRNALESLEDIISNPDTSGANEIITIHDEPSKKRIRFNLEKEDEDEERVCVSSNESIILLDDDYEPAEKNGPEISQNNIQDKSKIQNLENENITEKSDNLCNDNIQMLDNDLNSANDDNQHNTTAISDDSFLNTQNSRVSYASSPEVNNKKVPVLEKLTDEDLCQSEGEDVPLICAQTRILLNHVENNNLDKETAADNEKVTAVVAEVDTTKCIIDINDTQVEIRNVKEKPKENVTKSTELSVEDMMAAFVDEVIEDEQTDTKAE